jgi:NAD(P)-dependent dehydrogenase (short-subunit alcohol dehydrogenase family)
MSALGRGRPVELTLEGWETARLQPHHRLPRLQIRAPCDGAPEWQRHRQHFVELRHPLHRSPRVGYAATKAGVIQFSRVVAVQYAKHGIRVNTVIPGQMHTPMVEARLAKQRAGGDVEALLKERVSRIPLGFMGDGRDTAYAALFLASDEARFVTGTEIVVDGGMTARCD